MRRVIDKHKKLSAFRAAQDYRNRANPGRSPSGTRRPRVRSVSAEAKLNLKFVWARPANGNSRFSNGEWRVLYTAKSKQTCMAEVGYHLQNWFVPALKTGKILEVPHIYYQVDLLGNSRDFTHCTSDIPTLCASDAKGYENCQGIALDALRNDIAFMQVPSARDPRGECRPVFDQNSVSEPFNSRSFKILIEKNYDQIKIKEGKNITAINISRKY